MGYSKVSIIILNWNGKDDTVECLESLKKITYPNYNVVVVDNNSKGDDVKVLREMFGEFIQIIENNKNYEFAEGNNIGIRYALTKGTDYILLLNNDTIVDPEFLSEMVKIAEDDSEIGIVGPKIYFYDKPDHIWFAGGNINMWRCKTWHADQGEIDNEQYDSLQEVDYITGCALLVKREVIETIGLLDPDYLSYYEDTDWCVRAKQRGYKIVYVPKAKLWHKGGSSTGGGNTSYDSLFRSKRKGRNVILFMRKNAKLKHWLIFPFFALADLVHIIIRETLRGNIKSIIALMKGIVSNLSLKTNK